MDVRQLRCFVAIAEAGSLSKAAGQVGIAQPALSLKLAALERELGTRLFHRGNRGVTLTSSGVFLLKHATSILQSVNDVVIEIKSQDVSVVGKVRIGLPTIASELMGTALVRQVATNYPNLFLTIVEDNVNRLRRMLLKGQLDLAILVNEASEESLELSPLVTEQYCIVGSIEQANQNTTIDWVGLSQLPLLLPTAGTNLRKIVDAAALANGIKLNVVAELNSIRLLKHAAAAGLGFTVLPRSTVSMELDAHTLWIRRIGHPELRATLVLAASRIHASSSAQKTVRHLLISLVRELVQSGRWKAGLPEHTTVRARGVAKATTA